MRAKDMRRAVTWAVAVIIQLQTFALSIPEIPRWTIILLGFLGTVALVTREELSRKSDKEDKPTIPPGGM